MIWLKRILSLLLFAWFFVGPVFSQVVSVPVERYESWIQKIESYENLSLETGEQASRFKKTIKSLRLKMLYYDKKSSMDSLTHMTELAILNRDYRLLESDLEEFFKKCERISRKIKRRNQIIICESGALAVLLLILIF